MEDTLTATLRFKNGALATITATTTAAPGFSHRVEIYGTEGGFQVDGNTVVRWDLVSPNTARVSAPVTGGQAEAGAGSDPKGEGSALFNPVYRDFIEAVRQNRPPAISGAEGRRSLETVLRIYDAAGIRPLR